MYIDSKEVDSFMELVVLLDIHLTGKSEQFVRVQANHSKSEIQKLLLGKEVEYMYYLNDGGYSRIIFNLEEAKVDLASDPLLKPQSRWREERVVELRGKIEKVLKARLLALEQENS